MDFTTLIAAIDLSTVATAILAVASLLVVPRAVAWGARRVLAFLR